MESIKVYRNHEVTNEVIAKMKEIALASIYDEKIIKKYYANLEKDIGKLIRGDSGKGLVIYMGNDWFLAYYESKKEIDIIDWVSKNKPSDKIHMITEMMKAFKDILTNSNGKVIWASMRHNTAFQLYYLLFEKDYFYEIDHHLLIDIAEDKEISFILQKYLQYLFKKYQSLGEVLNAIDNDKLLFNKHQNMLLHDISFKPTLKFMQKYGGKKR